MAGRRYFLLLDLNEDENLISEYEKYHRQVWPEVLDSLKESGIEKLEIFRWSNRMVMEMIVNKDFTFERKAELDKNNPKVQQWEDLMWQFQKALPGTQPGEKWQLMESIFEYENNREKN
jgi:L-rhamnose mutarotase